MSKERNVSGKTKDLSRALVFALATATFGVTAFVMEDQANKLESRGNKTMSVGQANLTLAEIDEQLALDTRDLTKRYEARSKKFPEDGILAEIHRSEAETFLAYATLEKEDAEAGIEVAKKDIEQAGVARIFRNIAGGLSGLGLLAEGAIGFKLIRRRFRYSKIQQ